MRGRVLAAAVIALIAAAYYAWIKQCPGLESMKGKVVLITGTSSGIGAELAIQYGRLGCRLAVAARRKHLLEASAEAARAAGSPDVLAVATDMSSREQVEHLINATISRFGQIDILILNHASVDDKMLLEHESLESLQQGLETVVHSNLFGSAYATYAAMPHLEASHGHIAVISSASANIPAPFHSAYVASKRAINGFFDTVRHEIRLAHRQVTIGIQVLGMIGTPEIMKDPGNHRLAIPVPQCASEIICAVQARWNEIFVPQWYAPMTLILNSFPMELQQLAVNVAYIFNSEEYVSRIAAVSS